MCLDVRVLFVDRVLAFNMLSTTPCTHYIYVPLLLYG